MGAGKRRVSFIDEYFTRSRIVLYYENDFKSLSIRRITNYLHPDSADHFYYGGTETQRIVRVIGFAQN